MTLPPFHCSLWLWKSHLKQTTYPSFDFSSHKRDTTNLSGDAGRFVVEVEAVELTVIRTPLSEESGRGVFSIGKRPPIGQ